MLTRPLLGEIEPTGLNRNNGTTTPCHSAPLTLRAMNEALTGWLMAPDAPDVPVTLEEFLHCPEWQHDAACRGGASERVARCA